MEANAPQNPTHLLQNIEEATQVLQECKCVCDHFVWEGWYDEHVQNQQMINSYIHKLSSHVEWFQHRTCISFLGNCYFWVVAVGDAEGWSFCLWLILTVMVVGVGPWSWILFHVSLHPFWELSLVPEAKTYTLSTVWLETCVHVITRLTYIFLRTFKPWCFGNAVNMNGFLEGCCTLFFEYFYN